MTPARVSVEEYLSTSYPDGDREYLDGLVVERNLGTPDHSALQTILIAHLAAFEKQFQIAVRPACRTRVAERRYRAPDVQASEKKTSQPQINADEHGLKTRPHPRGRLRQ